jgi:alanyl-tRNA synthetase
MSARFGQSPMSANVRESFLQFFKSKGHTEVESGSLIPSNDPTLMFTPAGMAPFKDVFTGKESRPYTRATSSQKCIRISGKHNDLENVGVTARHHTFFEMLGNFSFGDYFKEEAIVNAWELLTKVWEIPQSHLIVSVFGGADGLAPDDEARALWKKVSGLGDDRIIGLGMADNFWQMGDLGPCGPCTEIHFFHGDDPRSVKLSDKPTPDGKGWMEIWNLVFMQFERSMQNGEVQMAQLPKPCVDTGAGLERVSAVLQGKTSNYDTDLLRSLVDQASQIAQKPYRGTLADDDVSMRVIADHARTTAFLIAENVFPDRAAREYVLRRVMRRAIRHGHRLGIQTPFLHEVAETVTRTMGEAYPELVRARDSIVSIARSEEERFRETIDRGLSMLEDELASMKSRGVLELSGDVAFKLYDTYGFPLDLTQVIAEERALTVNVEAYNTALAEQRARSEGSKVGDKAIEDVWRKVEAESPATKFVGYDTETAEGKIRCILKGNVLVTEAHAGDKAYVMLDETPFYAESGGQVGDSGTMSAASVGEEAEKLVRVQDTRKPIGNVWAHEVQVEAGTIRVGDTLQLVVDHDARTATRRNHSATHLLHYALRAVLGPAATQKGSLVGPDRLRFDFANAKGLTAQEVERVEDLVNAKILENAPVVTEVLAAAEARSRGAVAMFGEKYGDIVRVLTMTRDSVEFCGGTHARALGEIGLFKILSESGIAAGVRRIEAVTGLNALGFVRTLEASLQKTASVFKTTPADLAEKAEKSLLHARALEKEVSDLKRKLAMAGGSGGGADSIEGMLAKVRDVGSFKALAVRVDNLEVMVQRDLAMSLRDRLGDQAVVLLGSVNAGKVQLVLSIAKEASLRVKAGDLIRPIAAIVGGTGGGKPELAQAGGADVSKADDAIEALFAHLS